MKEIKLRVLTPADRALLFVGLALLVSGVLFLVNEPWIGRIIRGGDVQATELGEVKTIKPDARRRLATELLWTGLEKALPLYDGDSIFIGSNGEMRARLKTGTEILFGPGVLAKLLRASDGTTGLDLGAGSLVIDLAAGTKLKLKDTTIDAKEAAQILASSDENGPLHLSSLKGNISLVQGAANINLREGESALSDASTLQIDPDAISLLHPLPGMVFWPTQKNPIEVVWTKPSENSNDVVEVANDPGFSKPIIRQLTRAARSSLPLTLKGGTYYVRVSNLDGRFLKLSRAHYMHVNETSVLGLLRPANGARFGLNQDSATPYVDIHFEWEARAGIQTYQLQISSKPDFTEITVSQAALTRNSYDHTFNAEGTYYWRVKASDESPIKDQWSQVSKLNVGKGGPDSGGGRPRAPELDQSLITREAGSRAPVSLGWHGIKANEFEVEVGPDPNFTKLSDRIKTAQNKTNWTPPGEGNFFWRVRALGKAAAAAKDATDAPEVLWSATGEMIFKTRAPVLTASTEQNHSVKTSNELKKPGPPIFVSWHVESPAPAFKVELARNADFKNALTQTVKGTSTNFAMSADANGKYYARVSAVGVTRKQLSLVSQVLEINYQRRLALGIPKPTSPENRVKILIFSADEKPIVFKWKPVPQASLYRVQVAKDVEFKEPAEQTSPTPSVGIKGIQPGSAYYWRVRAEYGIFVSEWSPLQVVTVGDK